MASRTKNKSNKLGHDPLAWMDDENSEDQVSLSNEAVDTETLDIENNDQDTKPVEVVESVDNKDVVIDAESTNIKHDDVNQKDEAEDLTATYEPGKNVISLPAYFGIAQVSDVQGHMKVMLAGDENEMIVDIDDLESIDTAAVQLLIAFASAIGQANKEIKYSGSSAKLNNIVDLLGVRHEIRLPG